MAEEPFVFKSQINSFHYFYSDAEHLLQLISRDQAALGFDAVRLSRSAILLYIFSLEALVNRALDAFLPERLREFVLEREAKLQVDDKWQLLPLVAVTGPSTSFDTSTYPWSHFVELIALRNDYVHPKHDRPAYYKALTSHKWQPLSWKEIPRALGVKETTVVYRQTLIPKDPYAIRPEHVRTAKKVVDDMIALLDTKLHGAATKDNWLHQDTFQMVYPPEKTFNDLPEDDNPVGPCLPAMPSSDMGGW
jgi:hypothetical protein